MNHQFNIDIASNHGIEEAIIIENIAFWTKKNIANNKNIHDGKCWIYNSVKAFKELFPYMTETKIYRVLKRLQEKGVIETGNYNKVSYDRTKWYCIIDKSILQTYKIHLVKMKNGNSQNEETIPDINTNINTDTKQDNIYSLVIDYLNLKANTNYKHTTPKTKKLIDARLKETFVLEDFKTVIDNKCKSWKGTEWEKFLRPETLFGTKFESYLNEKNKTYEKKEILSTVAHFDTNYEEV